MRRGLRRLAAAPALLALAASSAACGPARSPEAGKPWNVIVLLVDTLRADHLSLYGDPRPTSPFLESLARESVVFDHAQSQSGCTFPSVASILTSQPANLFMAHIGENGMAVPGGLPYLPDVLHRHGYATAAVSASLIVRDTPSEINHQGGYGRGFGTFDESCLEKSAACVQARAGEILRTLPEPFFLYLHYLDPHAPYRPPRWSPRHFATGHPARSWVRLGQPERIFRKLYEGDTGIVFGRQDLTFFRDLYDDEIRFLDGQLADFVRDLGERGLLSRTILVLMADHGEELLDHGHFGHCRNLAYQTLLHTPLLIRLPGGAPAGRREAEVDNQDVMPTILDYLGIGTSDGEPALAGRSLRLVIQGTDRPVHRLHFSLQGTVRTVNDGRFKLLVDLAGERAGEGAGEGAGGGESLYDLEADPGETRDVAAAHPRVEAALRHALERWVEAIEGADTAQSVRRAREHQRRLKALGYL